MNNTKKGTIIAQITRRDVVLGMWCLFLFCGFLYQGFVILHEGKDKAKILRLN